MKRFEEEKFRIIELESIKDELNEVLKHLSEENEEKANHLKKIIAKADRMIEQY